MKILIDARMWNQSGVGRYLRNLVSELQQLDKINNYVLLMRPADVKDIKLTSNFEIVATNIYWYGLKEQVLLPRLISKLNPDLVHFPHFNVPIFYSGKYVVTIHDLIHQKFQMRRATTHDPVIYQIKHQSYQHILKTAIAKASKIITVSKYVEQELITQFPSAKPKLTVTYEAVEDQLLKIAQQTTKKDQTEVLTKFQISQPFIFYIGNAHPHKNVEGLISAFKLVLKSQPNLQLVLAGNDHYFWQRLKARFQHPNIIYTGYVTDQEMVALYKSASVYVLPSFEEGFGIPLLEAMACQCPVVSSDRASLPEIGGDACIYFDPYNIEDMANKISQIIDDPKLAKKLVATGLKRYQQFSWNNLAKQTLALYKSA